MRKAACLMITLRDALARPLGQCRERCPVRTFPAPPPLPPATSRINNSCVRSPSLGAGTVDIVLRPHLCYLRCLKLAVRNLSLSFQGKLESLKKRSPAHKICRGRSQFRSSLCLFHLRHGPPIGNVGLQSALKPFNTERGAAACRSCQPSRTCAAMS